MAVLTVVIWVVSTFGLARAASVIATLERADISLGEAAQLTVTVQGRSAEEPQIPSVNGLDFLQVGQSSQIQVINGAMSANVSYTYAVTAVQPGSFTIPAIQAGRGADSAKSQPVMLKVRKSSAGSTPAMNYPTQNALPAPAVNGDKEQLSADEQQSFGFLRLVTPKKEFYVGEMVPVELKACFRAGVELRVDGLPRLNSDAFTMNKLGNEPVRSQQLINGVPYTVFTWSTVITAVKAGDFAMSVEIPITVTVRQRARRPAMGGPFDDDLFDRAFSGFFGSATQRQIALSSAPVSVKILSLPTESRPASFSGAVGQFDISAATSPAQISTGDPVTLTLKISGAGNFDRVTAPTVENNSAWKTYKPNAKFEAADSAGFAGTKISEQALVSTQSGKLEIPALAFSYFDPEQKQYVTKTTSPINVEVAPGQLASLTVTPNNATPTVTPSAASAASDLAPDKLATGHFTATLRPWILNPWIVVVALLPSVAALGAYFVLRRRQQLAHDPKQIHLANSQSALRTQLENMERAAAVGDTGSFFAAACSAFQNLLGLRWSLPPRTITLAEINARLNGEADGLRTIFGMADEVIYTGRAFAPDELRRLQALINNELQKLKAL
ncbi:MAG: BatD family protein [Limisphaerales bacterium]